MDFIKTYEVPLSLWNMIVEYVAPNEIYEVKSFLGEDLVDQSIELRFEIVTLLDIFKSYSDELASGDSSKFYFPEPPEVRDRLLKEIKFFVNGIREQARLQGRDPDKILENRHLDIIDYAYESSSSTRTTSTNSHISTSRSSYRATPISDRVNVNLVKEKLNYMEFEEVRNSLKLFLQDEVDQLSSDLIEIHNVLYDDDMGRSQSRASKHTISELKSERHELEQLMLHSSRPLSNIKPKNSSTPNIKKQLFKLVPDGETCGHLNQASSIKSPPRLKPLENKSVNKSSSYVESPLDLGLPETLQSTFDALIDRNNSSVSSVEIETVHPISLNSLGEKSSKYNSAQKFRQRILQNRKETLNF